MTIKLGIIGCSIGNGHPYSWSAIFNGYNSLAMKASGYPIIAEYLDKEDWPSVRILDAKVTSIWTQDISQSKHIAKASFIENVCSSLNELEESVDAVLLARDDAENHLKFAKQFLIAGKPIYIDKPIALSMSALNELYQYQQYDGQIFTCSALRYSPDLMLNAEQKEKVGKINSISSCTPKSWAKYAVHIIEPVLNMLDVSDKPKNIKKISGFTGTSKLHVEWESGVLTTFSALGDVNKPIKISVKGDNGELDLIFKNTFISFKSALKDFISGISTGECKSPFEFNAKVVNLIERGM
jgi:predicted dehydrogenase